MIVGCVLPPPTTSQAQPSPTRIADFQDIAEKAGLTMTNVFGGVDTKKYIIETTGTGVAIFDYDNDGWPDIFIVNGTTLEGFPSGKGPTNHLYHNNHDGTFTDRAVVAGAAFNEDGREQAGMGSTVGDYDGDGKLDIFKTNFSDDTSTLYRNNGNGTFDDVTFAAGLGLYTRYLGWGTMFLDFDNDGWPDLLLVNGHVYPEVDKQNLVSSYEEPRILYHNNGNKTFTDISAQAGPGITTVHAGRGLAIGDLWNDGRMSAVISNMNAGPSLLVNQVHSANHWVGFKTVGTKSNRDGIGARVTVKAGPRFLVDEVRSGSSYDSNNDLRIHFGLGSVTKIEWVQIRWPSGLTEQFDSGPVDQITILKEGSGAAVRPPANPS